MVRWKRADAPALEKADKQYDADNSKFRAALDARGLPRRQAGIALFPRREQHRVLKLDPAIYSQILRDPRLSTGAFKLWHLFRDMTGANDCCWPSLDFISETIHCNKTAIRGWVDELVKCEYISIERGHRNRTTRYFIIGAESPQLEKRGAKSHLKKPLNGAKSHLAIGAESHLEPIPSREVNSRAKSPQLEKRGAKSPHVEPNPEEEAKAVASFKQWRTETGL